ncbi:MAG TPA: hypothetical protein VGM58_07160, partial [Verrucomicrobiae bacterium]
MSDDIWFPISKMDAAQAQLDTAIFLLLTDGDLLSIHTLACAAYGILEDLNRHSKGDPMFKDCYGIMPEFAAKWRKWVSTPQNYLKHADKDPDVVLHFRPEITGIMVLETTHALTKAGGKQTNLIRAFNIWMTAATPEEVYERVYEIPDADIRIARLVRSLFGPADQAMF